jgi:hypothetical protein
MSMLGSVAGLESLFYLLEIVFEAIGHGLPAFPLVCSLKLSSTLLQLTDLFYGKRKRWACQGE